MITLYHGGHNAAASSKLVRWLATFRGGGIDPYRFIGLDRRHAAVRCRRRAHGDPVHRADLVVVVLPGFQRRGAGAAVAEFVDPMAAPQPALSWRQLRGLAWNPRGCHYLFCGHGARRLHGRDVSGHLFVRRHRLWLHHRDDRDLVRPHRGRDRSARLAHLASVWRLLFVVPVMVSFGKRIPAIPLYALFLIPLLAVMAL